MVVLLVSFEPTPNKKGHTLLRGFPTFWWVEREGQRETMKRRFSNMVAPRGPLEGLDRLLGGS